MPIYEYIEGGRVVERVLPVENRDLYPGRLTVPRRVNVCPRGPQSQGEQVIRGFYKCEQDMGSRVHDQMRREFGLTPAGVKKVWEDA